MTQFTPDMEFAFAKRKIEDVQENYKQSLRALNNLIKNLDKEYTDNDKVGQAWKNTRKKFKSNYELINEVTDGSKHALEVEPILKVIKRVYFIDTGKQSVSRYKKADIDNLLSQFTFEYNRLK